MTRGWTHEHDIRFPRTFTGIEFYSDYLHGPARFFDYHYLMSAVGLRDRSMIVYQLTRFANLCRRYGVTPIIAFSPMSWDSAPLSTTVSESTASVEKVFGMH